MKFIKKSYTATKLPAVNSSTLIREEEWFVKSFFGKEEVEIIFKTNPFSVVSEELLHHTKYMCKISVPRTFDESIELRTSKDWTAWVYVKSDPEQNYFFKINNKS